MGGERYTDPEFGVKMTHRFPSKFSPATATANGIEAMGFRLPYKAKLIKIGIIPTATEVTCSTTTAFALVTEGGTELATFVPGSRADLATGEATGCAPETATNIPSGQIVLPAVTIAGVTGDPNSSGSILMFFDYQEAYAGG